MVKLLENTFRAVNIGLVNEMAIMCDHLGVSVWEVIEAAATKPFGFMKFLPGPGLGGHCIPIDPMYLSWKLKSLNYSAHFIELAGDINNHMPDFVVERLGRAMNEKQKCFNGSRILILGVAYKRDVNDHRESPALRLFQLLQEQKARVEFHDPYISRIGVGDATAVSIRLMEDLYRPGKFTERVVVADDAPVTSLKEFDAILIVADHSCFDPVRLSESIRADAIVFDTRNMMKAIEKPNIFRL
jgi:UDP-N-acetyl-D-glucosamine dehydrogenase